ncbi:cyclophilin 3 putative (CyP3) [Leptomonas pyrrhocoris]|uniref:peptidylprolyl isomerase n=1 Tax=Leptomonas pyrrhocoris TaxID=157538 RepID=A0A0M9G7S1_LEPPY|nr:cyclophilin 3 putative (CyP3) [Leptomonas pyrrhocoris]KPA84149.1 cyclophilin 3 putative (CyP3) [Leptomonas pyrrhocoris]|eukprot:XP_015662588.1 cyclophilin 3 putative (CyP3) [Leptomonas pyrrhocoris]
MASEARVVQLQTSCGSLSVELYENYCADAFWQLACSGQLRRLIFRRVLAGFAIVGEVDNLCARCTTADEVAAVEGSSEGPGLRHVGAGLLSCRPVMGTPACSRFVVTLSPQPQLDSTQVVFGRVYSGFATVESIARMQVDTNFTLYTPVTTVKCITAVLPKGTPPNSANGRSAAEGCVVKSVSSVPLVSLLE